MCSGEGRPHLCGRVRPFGDPRIDGCVPLPADYRSLPRPSSAPCAKASALRPKYLPAHPGGTPHLFRGAPRAPLGVACPAGEDPPRPALLMQPTPAMEKIHRISSEESDPMEFDRFDHGVHRFRWNKEKEEESTGTPLQRGPRLALCGSQGAPGRAPGTGYATDGTGRSPPPRAPPLLASEEKLFRLSLERR